MNKSEITDFISLTYYQLKELAELYNPIHHNTIKGIQITDDGCLIVEYVGLSNHRLYQPALIQVKIPSVDPLPIKMEEMQPQPMEEIIQGILNRNL